MATYLFGTGGSCLNYLKSRLRFKNEEANVIQHWRTFTEDKILQYYNVKKTDKIVYSFAHPYKILLSFERRGFFNDDWVLPKTLDSGEDLEIKYRLLERKTLDCYLSKGNDLFRFGNHFDSFYNLKAQVLFIKDDGLTEDTIEYIKKWGKLDYLSDEPIKVRNSSLIDIPHHRLNLFKRCHGIWANHYDNLPKTFKNTDLLDFSYNRKYDN